MYCVGLAFSKRPDLIDARVDRGLMHWKMSAPKNEGWWTSAKNNLLDYYATALTSRILFPLKFMQRRRIFWEGDEESRPEIIEAR